jgi:hypothetical protein
VVRGCEVVVVGAAHSHSATRLLRGRVITVPSFDALHLSIIHPSNSNLVICCIVKDARSLTWYRIYCSIPRCSSRPSHDSTPPAFRISSKIFRRTHTHLHRRFESVEEIVDNPGATVRLVVIVGHVWRAFLGRYQVYLSNFLRTETWHCTRYY